MIDLMIHKFFAIFMDLVMENLGELIEKIHMDDLPMSRVWGCLYSSWVCRWSYVGDAQH